MRKILVVLISVFISTVAHGATMCVPDATYWAVLAPDKNGTSTSVDADGTWTVTFDYVTHGRGTTTSNDVVGVAACNEISGTVDSTAGTPSTGPDDTGVNCWCQMIKPLVSEWVFINTYASDSACASSCANACATRAQTNATFRAAMYGSVW